MKILNKLTIKHLKSNPKRTVVTIIGIILSTALMVGIGLLFSTVRDVAVQEIEQINGRYHVMIEVSKDKLDIISKNQNVKEYAYTSSIGFATFEGIQNEYKPYIHVLGTSENYLKDLNLIEGRLPSNENEIIITSYLLTNGGLNLKVGDKISLDLGTRVSIDGYELKDNPFTNESVYDKENDKYSWIINEQIINKVKKEYTIVGICERGINENYSIPGYSVFTYGESNNYNVYIIYKKVKNTYKYTNTIATNLGYKEISEDNFEKVNYNRDLLAINGVTKYNNITESLGLVICIILSLVSIACIIVIYNSFAISVMERKKQFGLFSSIGTTKKQLRHTVFYEAFIVGIIGIPLGVLSAYLGIGIVIAIINKLLPNVFAVSKLNLVTYPLFIIIPVVFMIITILISAYLPAKMASKVSPIEAIRQNDDIKIKSKKVRSPKFITKLFGVEGDIAYKNMKRNKKKYRITIISLFISIVLFISFSSLVKYGLESSVDFAELPEYEYVINISPKKENISEVQEIINKVVSIDGIKKYTTIQAVNLFVNDLEFKYSKELLEKELASDNIEYVKFISLNKEAYLEYKKEIGLKENRPILINKYKGIVYTNNSRKSISAKIFDEVSDFSASYYDYENEKPYENKYLMENVYYADKYPMGIDFIDTDCLTIIIDKETFNKIYNDENNKDSYFKTIYILADKYDEIDKVSSQFSSNDISLYTYNLKEEMKMIKNMILVIKILLYGFISLVTLIGVTSVLNTINTSIALRRKEFAVLRSIGLTPKGFNKILFFESLFFGLKSLLYGIPVGLIITFLLHLSFGDLVEFDHFMIPYESIIISIVGVFIIIMISMWYATRKIKKENILNAIREENI